MTQNIAVLLQEAAAQKSGDNLREQKKIEQELHPLLKALFHLEPFALSKHIQNIVIEYADCASKEELIAKHAPDHLGKNSLPQLLIDSVSRVSTPKAVQ